MFSRLLKLDGMFLNDDATKFSIKKITTVDQSGKEDEYFTFSDGIRHKFPGYNVDNEYIVRCIDDYHIDKNELF